MFDELIKKGTIEQNVALSGFTSFKIGGPAKYLAMPSNDEELRQVIRECKAEKIDYYIIGNGTNLLVSDKGFDGCIICMKGRTIPFDLEEKEDRLKAVIDAGVALSKISMDISKRGYKGFEFATGIPGTVGGAVCMNAGAYGGEMKDCVKGADVLTPNGEIVYFDAEKLELSYRHSVFSKDDYKDYVVLRAYCEFEKGDSAAITLKITEQLRARRDKQPLNFPSAGSTFKRPEGYFAGKLIQDAGMQGVSVGGACVSKKHANFIVNNGGATAQDVCDLIKLVQDKVLLEFGVRLEPEVRFLGVF